MNVNTAQNLTRAQPKADYLPEAHDFLNLDGLLSEEERTVRDEIRGFTQQKLRA